MDPIILGLLLGYVPILIAFYILWQEVDWDEREDDTVIYTKSVRVNGEIENAIAEYVEQRLRNEYFVKGNKQPLIRAIKMLPDRWIVNYEINEEE